MTKGRKQRAAEIRKRAWELADSGHHGDHRDVELALRAEGYSEAHEVLADEFARQDLDNRRSIGRAKNPK